LSIKGSLQHQADSHLMATNGNGIRVASERIIAEKSFIRDFSTETFDPTSQSLIPAHFHSALLSCCHRFHYLIRNKLQVVWFSLWAAVVFVFFCLLHFFLLPSLDLPA